MVSPIIARPWWIVRQATLDKWSAGDRPKPRAAAHRSDARSSHVQCPAGGVRVGGASFASSGEKASGSNRGWPCAARRFARYKRAIANWIACRSKNRRPCAAWWCSEIQHQRRRAWLLPPVTKRAQWSLQDQNHARKIPFSRHRVGPPLPRNRDRKTLPRRRCKCAWRTSSGSIRLLPSPVHDRSHELQSHVQAQPDRATIRQNRARLTNAPGDDNLEQPKVSRMARRPARAAEAFGRPTPAWRARHRGWRRPARVARS